MIFVGHPRASENMLGGVTIPLVPSVAKQLGVGIRDEHVLQHALLARRYHI